MELSKPVGITRTRLKATAKEETIAGIQEVYIVTGDRQEGEGRKDEWYTFSGNVGEVVRPAGETIAVPAVVEEASEGVW